MQSIVPLNLNHSSISATPVPESSVAGPSTAGPSAATVSANKRKQDRERACDACRRRKTRCDGSRMPNNVCTNCLQTKKSCTYIEISKPRGPPKAYVVGLEDRLEKMEALLRRLRPEADFSAELGPPVVRGSWRTDAPYDSQPPTNASSVSFTPSIPYPSLPSLTPLPASKRGHSTDYFSEADSWASDEYSSDEEDEIAQHLTKNMKRLNILELDPGDKGNRLLDSSVRFHGSSSAFRLVNATRELQTQHLLETAAVEDDPSPGDLNGFPDVPMEGLDLHSRRGEYWQAPVWELDYEGVHITSPKVFPNLQQSWPPVDLAQTLIDLYFQHYNSMFPLLHYPTFAKHFTDKLYERDIWFACVCMSVFALGSRHSYDERVLPDDPSQYTSPPDDEQLKWQQAGMKFFLAATDVIVAKRSMVTPTGLFEVQTLCLAAQYQADTRWHTGAWLMVGIGVRKAEDVGAHRKKSYGTTGPSVEDELWKRAWWHLVAFDRIRSAMLGLPCATREEDYDAELPLEVDDEYWENEDPALAFKQPSGKPSMVTGYNIWLRLSDILAYVMRVFCAPDSMDSVMGVTGPRRPENILNQLNERLLEWTKIVPEHLRWSPDIQNPVFANQSATLYITYNITAILIRCAILPPSSPRLKGVIHPDSPEDDLYTRSLSSLAIAVNAARAGTRIIEVIRLRGLSNIPMLISASDICASVLGLHIWLHRAKENRRRMKGLEPNLQTIQTVDSLMADLDSLLEGLEWATPRWENAEPMLRQLYVLNERA
ncbi:hypothetical protein BV25DRAFT_1811483 [Artomyces pyxidatus]|uniref:Uncharacterized protein n=1 Tax=Artomyces pyxidatus TaxID=48021 RepID=A0ACB8SNT0_9AGAM|nr:hypothetical protein BV25DRAFT_1811483 [Artomyces pyxidatus]